VTDSEKISLSRAIDICNNAMLDDPETALSEHNRLKERQLESRVMFGTESVPTLPRPHFLTAGQIEKLKYITTVIMGCLEKVIKLYFESDALKEVLVLSDAEREMVGIDPGISRVIHKARLDSFFEGDDLKFLEFNCDSPAAVGYGDCQTEIFKSLFYMNELEKEFEFEWVERRRMMLETLIDAYRDFGGKKEYPVILITDWRDVKTIHEFYILKEYFESMGYETVIADPRDLELRGDVLYADGKIVDMVYRRVIIKEVLEKKGDVGDLLEAIKRKTVCVVNPFRAKIVSNKSTLAVLTDPKFDHLFTDEENRVIAEHVPWTRNLKPGKVVYEGTEWDICDLVEKKRENFVIKPCDGYGGKGVKLGWQFTDAEWRTELEAASESNYVIQDMVHIPVEEFPVLKNGKYELQERYVNLNPFAIGGKYGGCISRISMSPIINVSAGGGMVPTFTIKSRT